MQHAENTTVVVKVTAHEASSPWPSTAICDVISFGDQNPPNAFHGKSAKSYANQYFPLYSIHILTNSSGIHLIRVNMLRLAPVIVCMSHSKSD